MSSKPVYKAKVGSPHHQSVTSGRRGRPSDMMILLVIAALAAAAGAARLDRTYLPPPSAAGAGGAPGSLRAPLQAGGAPGSLQAPPRAADPSAGLLQQPLATARDAIPSFRVPAGGYENDHQGVVVDAAAAGLRAVNRPSGLGDPRTAYGSPDSKVGEAAFRGTENSGGSQPPRAGGPGRVQYESPGFVSANGPADLAAFRRPPGPPKPQIQILRDPVSNTIKYQNDIGIDKFEYAFETENGIKMEGTGVSADGLRAQGGYSYTGDDGRLYSVRYTADEGGFRPVGAHLPTPPPVPQDILHSLRQNARDEAGGRRDDGSYDDQKYNTGDDYTKSDANGKYNDGESNTFGEPSGADASTSGVVVHQNGKDNAKPSNNGQFNSFDSSKDGSSLPSKTSFGSLGSDNKANRENYFFPNGRNDGLNNDRFGSQFQYLPPAGNGQSLNTYLGSYISKDGNVGDVKVSSQKKLPVPSLFEKQTSLTGQSYYGSPGSEQAISNNKLSRPSQGAHIFGISKGPLKSDQALNDKQYQKYSENTNIPNRGMSQQFGSPSLEGFQSSPDFNDKSQTSFGDSLPSLISKSPPYFGIKPYKEYTSVVPVSGSNSDFSQNIPDGDSNISEQAVLPTKIPQFTPTNPVENQGISTFLNSNKPQQSSSALFPTSISTVAQQTISSLSSQTNSRVGLDEIPTSQFRPTNTHSAHGVYSPFIVPSRSEFNKVNGQTQSSDDSYVYNKPLITFDIPSGRPYTPSQDSFFTNKPQDLFISTQQQSQPELSKYPQASTFDIIKPTLATSYKDGNKDNIYQTNGVTQASISPFPSIVPTSSSVSFTTPTLSAFPHVGSTSATTAAQFISTNSGDQIYNIANQLQFGQHPSEPENKPQNSGVQSQVQNYNGEVYEYNKPAMKLFASPQKQSFQTANFNNTPQFGQHIPNTQKLSSSQINQQSTPSQFDAPTSSQFGTNTGSSFDQQTTPPRPNEQAGLPFGQKSTPPRFDLQTSLSVGPQTTPSRFGDQNTPSVGPQTTPSRFGDQNTPSVGPQTTPSRFGDQNTPSVGPQTMPSRFGDQNTPSVGPQTTPSRFGDQNTPSVGPQTTPSRFGDQNTPSVGPQTTPSRFGDQNTPSVGPQTTLSRFGDQNTPSVGQQTTPSRFGDQNTPSVEQETTPTRFGDQNTPSGGQQTTPTRFRDQNKPSVGQQTTPSRFGDQNTPSVGQQTTPSRFGDQNTPSVEQETTPTRFGDQNTPSVGQQTTPTRFGDQNTPSVGQQTTPSRFGDQNTPSVEQETTPTRFGDQNTPSVGQQTTPTRFGDQNTPSVGQQTTPSRFGDKNTPSVEQQTTPTRFGDQNTPSVGQQTSPPRISGIQTGTSVLPQNTQSFGTQGATLFGQKTAPSTFGAQTGPSFGHQTTPARFGAQTDLSSGHRPTTAPFGDRSKAPLGLPSTSQQSGSIGPQQSPSSGQSDRQDFTGQHTYSIAPDRQQVLTQSNKQFPSNLGTRPENQIKPQSFSSFQKGKVVKPTEGSEFASKPINSQVPQNVQKFGNDRLPSQSPGLSKFQSGVDSLKQNAQNGKVAETTFNQENLLNSKPFGPRPQSSFQSACCSGFRYQNQGVSQNPSGDGSIGQPTTSFGTGGLGLSRTEPTRGDVGRGEQFGGPREPPRFDATGYHY